MHDSEFIKGILPSEYLETFDVNIGEEINSDEAEVDQAAGERGGMRSRPQPRAPTQQERADHEIDHYPYRSWCAACVDGSGRADSHERGQEEQNTKKVVSFDYGRFTDSTKRLTQEEKDEADPTPS